MIRLHTPLSIIMQMHGAPPSPIGRLLISAIQRMERSSILNADAVSCPSAALAARARTEMLLGALPITVYPNPVDTTYFSPTTNTPTHGLYGDTQTRTILYVGQMAKHRGMDAFLDVLPALLNRDEWAQFVLAGLDRGDSNGVPWRVRIESCLPNEERERVMFLGRLNWHQLRELYRAACCCVLPSRFEAFGQVCVESMACGCPLVGSGAGGMAKIIRKGVDGYLVDPADTAGIAMRISDCLERLRSALGHSAGARARSVSSFANVASQAEAFLQRLVAPEHTERRTTEVPR